MYALVVCVGPHQGAVLAKQVEGFIRHAAALERELGLSVRVDYAAAVARVPHRVTAHRPELCIIAPHWTDSEASLIGVCEFIRRQRVRPMLVVLDTSDPTSSPHFGVLPYVDLFLKTKMLRDREQYRERYAGGHVLSDHAARVLGFDLGEWSFGTPMPMEHAAKVRPCWNFGISADFERIRRNAKRFSVAWERRYFDVNRRLGLSSTESTRDSWYKAYRVAAQRALEPLAARHRVTGVRRIPRKLYLFELMNSKIVFSPFGWGEVCFRDYEAAAVGALLFKPSTAHVATSPNIFIDHETYVPVKWDFSDLEEKVAYYLKHPNEAERIAANAVRVLDEYYHDGGFVRDVGAALNGCLERDR
ncbi:MAG TPA: glycosyltransferase [Phycisphaerales bacterium]|nr:glycosyltransferase [Phycisphaerales bacterium]